MTSAPELLGGHHDVSQFSCGKAILDNWLRSHALANQRKGFTVVMVVYDALRVVGYYGLAQTAVVSGVLPRSIRTGRPPNPVPCLLLGQLAVDAAWMGRGIGGALLGHALARCMKGAELIGGRAVVVNAVDDKAATFWQARGFLPSRDDPHRQFRSIADIADSLRAAMAQ